MTSPKFSVLLPVYKSDSLEYFKAAFRSVTDEQTIKPDQVVITVDGPLPQKLKIYIEKLEYREDVKCVWGSINKGLGIALDEGLKACDFEIVARMDSDDRSYPNRFEKQLNMMHEHDVVSANLAEFSSSIDEIVAIRRAMSKPSIFHNYWLKNPFNHPSIMFRKSAVLRVGGYIHMPSFEDWYLWIRMISAGARCDNIDESLVYFRSGDDQYDRRRGLKYLKKEFHFLRVLKRQDYIKTHQFLIRIVISCTFRLLPLTMFKFLTKTLLRK